MLKRRHGWIMGVRLKLGMNWYCFWPICLMMPSAEWFVNFFAVEIFGFFFFEMTWGIISFLTNF